MYGRFRGLEKGVTLSLQQTIAARTASTAAQVLSGSDYAQYRLVCRSVDQRSALCRLYRLVEPVLHGPFSTRCGPTAIVGIWYCHRSEYGGLLLHGVSRGSHEHGLDCSFSDIIENNECDDGTNCIPCFLLRARSTATFDFLIRVGSIYQ